MKSYRPLVSIVTPVYNGSRYIEELIESVLKQDYEFIEHIIIDDGSDDNNATIDILKRYPSIRWWSRSNMGAYATINEGLIASGGELVTVICADDMYASSTAISSAVKAWIDDPASDAVYGETILVDEAGCELDGQPPLSGPVWMFRYYGVIAHCSLFVRKSLIVDKCIYFDISYPYSADYVWIVNLIENGCRFNRIKKPIALFRRHSFQRSQDSNPKRIDEQRRIAELYGKLNPIILFLVINWVRFVRYKNLFNRGGFLACLSAIYSYFMLSIKKFQA